VYQGVVRGLGVDAVAELNRMAVGDVTPDLVVLLDVADAVAEARRGSVSDRLEAEGAAFHASVRAAYRDLAPSRDWVVVDANAELDDVTCALQDAVAPLLTG